MKKSQQEQHRHCRHTSSTPLLGQVLVILPLILLAVGEVAGWILQTTETATRTAPSTTLRANRGEGKNNIDDVLQPLHRKQHRQGGAGRGAAAAASAAGGAESSSGGGPSSSSQSGGRWTVSGRWEQQEGGASVGEQFLLKEKFGTYFKVPNPSTLMTKIVCTIGPKTSDATTIGRMMDAGMTAARINMSHGSTETASRIIDTVRKVAATRRKLCPIILDTKGPEIRVCGVLSPSSKLSESSESSSYASIQLNGEDEVALLTGVYSDSSYLPDSPLPNLPSKQVAVSYPYLGNSVRQGDVVLLDDGRISLIVTRVPSEDIVLSQVIEGGKLLNNKGVNLPGCHVELPHLTEKDESDILFGVSKNVEYIAHSFTRSGTGINSIRELPGNDFVQFCLCGCQIDTNATRFRPTQHLFLNQNEYIMNYKALLKVVRKLSQKSNRKRG